MLPNLRGEQFGLFGCDQEYSNGSVVMSLILFLIVCPRKNILFSFAYWVTSKMGFIAHFNFFGHLPILPTFLLVCFLI